MLSESFVVLDSQVSVIVMQSLALETLCTFVMMGADYTLKAIH